MTTLSSDLEIIGSCNDLYRLATACQRAIKQILGCESVTLTKAKYLSKDEGWQFMAYDDQQDIPQATRDQLQQVMNSHLFDLSQWKELRKAKVGEFSIIKELPEQEIALFYKHLNACSSMAVCIGWHEKSVFDITCLSQSKKLGNNFDHQEQLKALMARACDAFLFISRWPSLDPLTQTVIRCRALGVTRKQIAKEMRTADNTITYILAKATKALGFNNYIKTLEWFSVHKHRLPLGKGSESWHFPEQSKQGEHFQEILAKHKIKQAGFG